MKKVLALTLSAVLAMGAATTAFAATNNQKDLEIDYTPSETAYSFLSLDQDTEEDYVMAVASDKMKWDTYYSFPIVLDDPEAQNSWYTLWAFYDEDGNVIGAADSDDNGANFTSGINPGEDLPDDYDGNPVKVQDNDDLFELVDANKATLKVDVTSGRSYVESIRISEDGDEMNLDITTADTVSTSDGKITFELELKSRGSNSEFRTRTTEYKDVRIGYITASAANEVSGSMNVDEEGTVLDTDDMDATEDYEITWGDDEIARFIVDIDDNEGKKNLDYTTAPVDALIEANPEANMDFFTLKAAPRFNKIGEMTIYCDGDIFKYIYEVDTDGQLRELNAEYDEDEEGFVFNTRTLGSYVISDVELVGAAIEDEEVPGESDTEVPGESDTTTDDGRDNPETGANDMVNVAAAMAVVSLAAAGAVAFKKSSK